jgi:hypothetical protein
MALPNPGPKGALWWMNATTCPHCGGKLNATGTVESKVAPASGDVTICAHCLHVLQFDKGHVPRAMVPEHLALLLMMDEDFRASMEAAQSFVRRTKRAGGFG